MFAACMVMCYMCGGCQKRALNPLELELQKAVNPRIGAGSLEKQMHLTAAEVSFRNLDFSSLFKWSFLMPPGLVFFFLLSPGLSIFSGVLIPALCQYRWLVLNFISDWFEAWDDTCWNPCAFTSISNSYLTDLQCRGTAHPCFIPHPTALLWSWAEVLQPLPPSLAMTSSCLPLMSFSFGEPQHLNWVYNPIKAVNIWFYIFKALVIIAHLFLPGLTLFRRIVLFCF